MLDFIFKNTITIHIGMTCGNMTFLCMYALFIRVENIISLIRMPKSDKDVIRVGFLNVPHNCDRSQQKA